MNQKVWENNITLTNLKSEVQLGLVMNEVELWKSLCDENSKAKRELDDIEYEVIEKTTEQARQMKKELRQLEDDQEQTEWKLEDTNK